MRISVIGTGYVGLVTGACFAKLGHDVTCVDINIDRVEEINRGVTPIYEEGLEELLRDALAKKKLRATTEIDGIVDSDISFICVGTPSGLLDYIDLKYIEEVASKIGKTLRDMSKFHMVVVKSTVVPGTTEFKVKPTLEKESGKRAGKDFGVAMNPEFLREGKAVEDFLHPDRIVIGSVDERSNEILLELYEDFDCPVMTTNPSTAEMIKYATNSFLVTKISFINEVGNICKELGIDVYDVAKGIGLDSRISPKFLNAGIGFGGSCFPKDVKALVGKAKEVYYRPILLHSALEINDAQALRMVELLEKKAGSLTDKGIAVLGLAFKPGTDDMREAQTIKIVHSLMQKGARVFVTDPRALNEARKIFGEHENLVYCDTPDDAVENCEYVLIATEWDEYRREELYRGKIVIDGRRIDEARVAEEYVGICW
ncbi:MAG: UDP-glucose dehydrogenase family protein [Candidatus Hydrothermarchaeaceae archaeon]